MTNELLNCIKNLSPLWIFADTAEISTWYTAKSERKRKQIKYTPVASAAPLWRALHSANAIFPHHQSPYHTHNSPTPSTCALCARALLLLLSPPAPVLLWGPQCLIGSTDVSVLRSLTLPSPRFPLLLPLARFFLAFLPSYSEGTALFWKCSLMGACSSLRHPQGALIGAKSNFQERRNSWGTKYTGKPLLLCGFYSDPPARWPWRRPCGRFCRCAASCCGPADVYRERFHLESLWSSLNTRTDAVCGAPCAPPTSSLSRTSCRTGRTGEVRVPATHAAAQLLCAALCEFLAALFWWMSSRRWSIRICRSSSIFQPWRWDHAAAGASGRAPGTCTLYHRSGSCKHSLLFHPLSRCSTRLRFSWRSFPSCLQHHHHPCPLLQVHHNHHRRCHLSSGPVWSNCLPGLPVLLSEHADEGEFWRALGLQTQFHTSDMCVSPVGLHIEERQI